MLQNHSVGVSSVREHNQLAILETIYNKGSISRAMLAKELHISKPAVADNLEYLIAAGLVIEAGEGESAESGGRKPRMLRFDGSGRYVISIDLNFSRPLFVLGNLNNEIVSEFEVSVNESADMKAYLSIIKKGIQILMASRGLEDENLVCIAISSPGIFDSEGNLRDRNPSYRGIPWANIDIRPYLSENFDVPVIVRNDIHAATIGEWAQGNSTEDMIFLGCGLGVGAGIVLDGELLEGKNFSAGQLYNYTDFAGFKAGMSLEDRICMNALLQKSEAALSNGSAKYLKASGDNGLCFQDIVYAYEKGDPIVLDMIYEIGLELAVVVSNMMNFLSIRNLVIGGEYAVFGDCLLNAFDDFFSCQTASKPQLGVSLNGRYSGIYGLMYLARNNYFRVVCKRPVLSKAEV